jgi:hypothetical protein
MSPATTCILVHLHRDRGFAGAVPARASPARIAYQDQCSYRVRSSRADAARIIHSEWSHYYLKKLLVRFHQDHQLLCQTFWSLVSLLVTHSRLEVCLGCFRFKEDRRKAWLFFSRGRLKNCGKSGRRWIMIDLAVECPQQFTSRVRHLFIIILWQNLESLTTIDI